MVSIYLGGDASVLSLKMWVITKFLPAPVGTGPVYAGREPSQTEGYDSLVAGAGASADLVLSHLGMPTMSTAAAMLRPAPSRNRV